MRENWEIKKLAQVSGFQNGFAFKSKTFKEEGIPVIRITNIQDQSIDFSKVVYVNPKDYDKDLTKYHIVKGDLLIAMSGATTGKIGINNSDNIALLNQRVGKFEPNEDLLKLFLYYFLSTKVEESLAISAGSAQPNLSTEQIKNFEIPIPPIEEQKEIVEILDQAFESIEKAKANIEKNIENAKELFQSKKHQLFSKTGHGWECKKLKEVTSVITDGTHQTPKYFESGYIFLSSKNVTSGKIDWDNVKYLDEEQHKKMYSRLAPQINDILLAKNGTTGVAAIVDVDKVFDIYVSLALLRPLEIIFPRYLLHFINSVKAKKQFNKRLKGVGVPNLHLKEIREVEINYPISIEEQKRIVEKLDILENHIQSILLVYKEELKNLEELKKSILQKAFSGELTNKNKAA